MLWKWENISVKAEYIGWAMKENISLVSSNPQMVGNKYDVCIKVLWVENEFQGILF